MELALKVMFIHTDRGENHTPLPRICNIMMPYRLPAHQPAPIYQTTQTLQIQRQLKSLKKVEVINRLEMDL
jgi:hypothetical protein